MSWCNASHCCLLNVSLTMFNCMYTHDHERPFRDGDVAVSSFHYNVYWKYKESIHQLSITQKINQGYNIEQCDQNSSQCIIILNHFN